MTAMSAALVLAALACRPGVAPFFTLPEPAVMQGTLRAASVPGAVPKEEAALRLDGHAMAAMFGTAEAFLERQILPSLIDFGGARGKSLADLRTSDFVLPVETGLPDIDKRTNAVLSRWHEMFDHRLPSPQLAFATNRDFSARGRRVLEDVSALVGSYAAVTNYFAPELNPTEGYWLDPRIDHKSLPTGEWCLDDETATADWSKYLLFLGEVPAEGVFSEDNTPFVPPVSLGFTDAFEWSSYMEEGGFPTLSKNVYDTASGSGRTYGVCPSGTARGRAMPPMADFLSGLASGSCASNVWGRRATRGWYEQYALANAVSAACSVLLDQCDPNSFYSVSDLRAGYSPSADRGPTYLFSREDISGDVSGSLTLKADGKGVAFGGQSAGDGVKPAFVMLVSPDDFETAGVNSEEDVAYSTSTAWRVTSAWNDTSGRGSARVSATAPVRAELLRLDATQVNGVEDGTYPLLASVSADVTGMYSFDLYMRVGGSQVPIGHFAWPEISCWTSTVSVAYSANVIGVEAFDVKRPFVGPTFQDTPSLATNEGWTVLGVHSIRGFGYHPMLFGKTNPIIRKADLHSFAAVGCTTNDETIALVAGGNDFAWGRPKDGENVRKDTWAYFRSKVLFGEMKDENEIRVAFENAYNDMKGAIRECAGRVPGASGYSQPGNRAATNVDEGQLREIAAELLAEPFELAGTDPTPWETGASVRWDGTKRTLTPVVGGSDAAGDGATVFRLEYVRSRTHNAPMRKSIAATYILSPYLITQWDFPMMGSHTENSRKETTR